MTSKQWKTKIKKQMKELSIYNKAYDYVIDSLSDILEQRDATYEEFVGSGGSAVVEYTNKAGATNLNKNPLLVAWDELNKTALIYWKELGLTPQSYKKITGDKPKVIATGGLAQALASLES